MAAINAPEAITTLLVNKAECLLLDGISSGEVVGDSLGVGVGLEAGVAECKGVGSMEGDELGLP